MTSTLHDTNPTEALAPHTPEGQRMDQPGAYAVTIDVPEKAGHETVARDWLAHYESLPPYLDVLADAKTVAYVGASKNVRGRIQEHLGGDVRTATLPSVWGVRDLVTVWWFDTAAAAFEHEQRCADELAREHPAWFVHSR